MELRLRTDVTNNECTLVQAKIDALRDRASTFVDPEHLAAVGDIGAGEIAELNAELARTEARAYEVYETRMSHEQVIKRLKEEAVSYPRQLEGIERTAHAKDHDHATLQLMLKDASHVRDVARQELSKAEESVAHERKERGRVLQARRRKLQQKQEASQAHERRVAARREVVCLEKEAAVERREVAVSQSEPELASELEQIAYYEAQFAQIKEVAGADGVNEVLDKFTAQEETHRTLVHLSRESQSRIDTLIAQRTEAKKALEHTRYAGGPIIPLLPGAAEAVAAVNGVEERERQHETAQMQGQRERQRAQRLHRVSGMIVEARVAIEHLSNIVTTTAQLPRLPGSSRRPSLSLFPRATAGESAVSDAELAQQLRGATAQLDILFAEVAQEHEGRSPLAIRRQLPRPASSGALLSEAGPPHGPQDEALAEAETRVLNRDAALLALTMEEGDEVEPLFKLCGDNVRIDASGLDDDDDDDDDEEDPDNPTDPVIDRETLKKNARLLLKKKTNPGKRALRRKGGGGGDDDDGARPASPSRPGTAVTQAED